MPSSNKVLLLAAILAVSTAAAAAKHGNIRKTTKKTLRRREIHHVDLIANNHNEGEGLEEEVAFFTNLVRRAQYMSIPMPSPTPPGPTPDTDPPVVGDVPTPSPMGVITNPPVPVVGVICEQGESCNAEGDVCSDGTTEECCGEVFDSFQCVCVLGDDDLLTQDCDFTDACLDRDCDTGPPVSGPNPTPAPVPPPVGFNCPDPDFVGCTAVDPTQPTDECDTIGEPCEFGNEGEFCCLDGCPRNYCTAKQAAMSSSNFVPLIKMQENEIESALENTIQNDP